MEKKILFLLKYLFGILVEFVNCFFVLMGNMVFIGVWGFRVDFGNFILFDIINLLGLFRCKYMFFNIMCFWFVKLM